MKKTGVDEKYLIEAQPGGAHLLSRRAMIQNGILFLGALRLSSASGGLLADEIILPAPVVRMGVITDIHYADKPSSRTRFYKESLPKMTEAVDKFNRDKVDCVIELGDLIDAGETPEQEMAYLNTIETELERFNGPRHYVLGNHDAWSLTKADFLGRCGASREFYSFDQGGFHFVILDACYRADGVPYGKKNFKWTDTDIPIVQQEWLKADLKQAKKPAIVFVHQRLDVHNNYAVKSAPAVRKILEASGQVRAVFQGHSHKNDYHEIKGIHYCTLRAIVEGEGEVSSGYSTLSIFKNGTIAVAGFRLQTSYNFPG